MGDLSITAANVVPSGGGQTIKRGIAGETITAGQAVIKDPVTKKYLKADANGAYGSLGAHGIAMNGASLGQAIAVCTKGDIVSGGSMTAGLAYYLSATAGALAVVADITGGPYATIIGAALSASVLRVNPIVTGVAP